MSRTIRRTKARKHYTRFEKDYTHAPLNEWFDVEPSHSWRPNGMPVRPLEGEAYIKRKWQYYSDRGCPGFWFEDAFERPYKEDEGELRARYKCEIAKWLKDHDYEIINTPRKSVWDYY